MALSEKKNLISCSMEASPFFDMIKILLIILYIQIGILCIVEVTRWWKWGSICLIENSCIFKFPIFSEQISFLPVLPFRNIPPAVFLLILRRVLSVATSLILEVDSYEKYLFLPIIWKLFWKDFNLWKLFWWSDWSNVILKVNKLGFFCQHTSVFQQRINWL